MMLGQCVPVLALCAVVALAYPSAPVLRGFSTEAHLQNENSWKTQKFAHRRISNSGALLEGPALPSHPDITQVVTQRPVSLGSDHNLRQEPPTQSEDELQVPRRRRQSPDLEAEADDDSDMYLEPDEEPAGVAKQQAKPSEVVARYEYGLDSPRRDNQGHPQNFYPSFAPVFSLGHSRPPQLYHPIGEESEFYKPVRSPQSLRALGEFNPFKTIRDAFLPPQEPEEEASTSNNILGSGNFGVIRGGTYYNDEDRASYYNNGHGRPYFNNPLPQKNTGGDFFANFRDFADINVSPKASFSEYVIVYVNKNGTAAHLSDPARPKNIIEQLSLLDQQDAATPVPEKKISSHKRKLAVLRRDQSNKEVRRVLRKKETAKDFHEPLLALS